MADVRVLADTPHLETPLPRFVLTLTCPFSGAAPHPSDLFFSEYQAYFRGLRGGDAVRVVLMPRCAPFLQRPALFPLLLRYGYVRWLMAAGFGVRRGDICRRHPEGFSGGGGGGRRKRRGWSPVVFFWAFAVRGVHTAD